MHQLGDNCLPCIIDNVYNIIFCELKKNHNIVIMSVSEINVGQKRILPIRQRQLTREQAEKPFGTLVAV